MTLPGLLSLQSDPPPGTPLGKKTLREWWHKLLRQAGKKYPCFAIFLANLPADKETANYLHNYRVEIDRLSGENCLIIILGDKEIGIAGFDNDLWQEMVNAHLNKANSVIIADLFDVKYDDFPCLLLFQDIRQPEHVVINLKDMSSDEIASKMRTILSIIKQAIIGGESPLQAIEKNRHQEMLKHQGKVITAGIVEFTKVGFETAMKTWIKASFG
jgi:hypothetical protein